MLMESRRRGGGAAGRRGAARPQQQEVKVTHIITTEVSADEASFKDVVQRLTGKDSAPARAAVLAASATTPRASAGPSRVNNGDAVAGEGGGGSAGGVDRGAGAAAPPAAPPATFEGTLPSLEEMNRWWGTHD